MDSFVRTAILVVASAVTSGCGLSAAGIPSVGDEAGAEAAGRAHETDGAANDGRVEEHADATRSLVDGGAHRDVATIEDAHAEAPRASSDAAAPDAHTVDAGVRDARTVDTGHGVDAMDAAPPVYEIVQTAQATGSRTANVATSIGGTRSGDFLAVLVIYSGAASVASVTDDASGGGDTYASASLLSIAPGNCQASEIWYARDLKAGATSVSVTMTAGVTSLWVWVLEASGMRESGGVDNGTDGTGGATNTITAPTVTPTGAPALVVSAVGSCGSIGGISGGNPFTALPAQGGNGAAYYIALTPGTYGPVFGNNNKAWNASVAAFR